MIMNVRLSRLLLLYAILPVSVVIVLMDKFLWNHAVLAAIPFRPESWLIWIYLFGMPHVVGGMQMFADSEYLKKYGCWMARILVFFLALPVVLAYVLGEKAVFFVFVAMIVYHTVAQQLGLMLTALKRGPDVYFYALKWSMVGLSAIIYLMMYWAPVPLVFVDDANRSLLMLMAAMLMAGVVVAAGGLMWKNRSNRFGVFCVFANMALVGTEFYLFFEGYYLFVVVVGRVVHEFTAWPIYMVHDHNRGIAGGKNWLFEPFRGALPRSVLTLVVAFGMGIALTYLLVSVPVLASVIVSLSLYHYYTESFLWRKESLLRRHVAFVR